MFKLNIAAGLNSQRANKDGEYPLRIRVTINRKPQYTRTNIMLRKDQWVNGQVVNHPNKGALNAVIRKTISNMQQDYFDRAAAGQQVDNFKANANISFKDFAEAKIKTWARTQTHITIRNKTAELGKFLLYQPAIKIKDMNNQVVAGYEEFCIRRGNVSNTISASVKFVKTVLNAAYHDGVISKPALLNYSGAKYKNPKRVYLTAEEIDLVENFAATSKRPTLVKVANWFLFSCYSGLRYDDVRTFDKSMISNNRLILRTGKTESDVSIKIHPKLAAVLNRISPNVFSNQKVNAYLEIIKEACGIDKHVTMHTARHTSAVYFLNYGGSMAALKEFLGHASIKTTEIYGKVINTKLDREVDEVWGGSPLSTNKLKVR